MNLKDKVIVITGGTKGLGRAFAEGFIAEGSRVIICSTNKEEVQAVASEIGVLGVCADVTIENDMTRLADEAIGNYGEIDVWVNNAGVWIPHMNTEDFDMNKVRRMFDINILGTIHGSRVALRTMKEKKQGVLLNVISDSALVGRPMSSAYSASKWAVNGFTKSIREENPDVTVLAIFPGAFQSSIFGDVEPAKFSDFMLADYVVNKTITNLKLENPEEDLIIQKPIKN